MHIHGSMNMNAASLYSAAGAEKAAEAKRAADVRKKLLSGAEGIDGESTPEESMMISRWLNGGSSQSQRESEYRDAAAGKDPDFG